MARLHEIDLEALRESHRMLRFQGERFADAFYQALWTQHPETLSLFRQKGMPEQKRALMEGLWLIVYGMSKPDELGTALTDMGIRHRSYGVLAEHYGWVADAWRTALADCLGDRWDGLTERNWERVMEVVTDTMRSGARWLDEGMSVVPPPIAGRQEAC